MDVFDTIQTLARLYSLRLYSLCLYYDLLCHNFNIKRTIQDIPEFGEINGRLGEARASRPESTEGRR